MVPKYKNIKLEIKDKIARITLDRPDKRNAMNSALLMEVDGALDHILAQRRSKDSQVRVVLFCGAGNHFTGGADIKEMRDLDNTKAYEFSRLGQTLSQKLERFPIPIIAVIQGFCVGGGVELTSACDMRIASKDALFGQPEINIGIVTGWGSSQRLPRIVGISKAKELMYTGKVINADEAYRIGLIDIVVPRNKLDETALEIAQQITNKPIAAIAAAKETVLQASLLPLDAGLEFERKSFGALFGTHDQKEAMSAFLEKRKANFTDTIDDYFNLNRYPWKGTDKETRKTNAIGPNPFDGPSPLDRERRNPFLAAMEGLKLPGMDMATQDPLMKQWMDMQKMGTEIMQKQAEMVWGGLFDFSKMMPKWMK